MVFMVADGGATGVGIGGGVVTRGGGATAAGGCGTFAEGVAMARGAVDVPIAAAAEYLSGGRFGFEVPALTTAAIGCCT